MDFIKERLIVKGSRFTNGYLYYYDSADPFQYFLSNCVAESRRAAESFGDLLKEKVGKSRYDGAEYPLDAAMKILAASTP